MQESICDYLKCTKLETKKGTETQSKTMNWITDEEDNSPLFLYFLKAQVKLFGKNDHEVKTVTNIYC